MTALLIAVVGKRKIKMLIYSFVNSLQILRRIMGNYIGYSLHENTKIASRNKADEIKIRSFVSGIQVGIVNQSK